MEEIRDAGVPAQAAPPPAAPATPPSILIPVGLLAATFFVWAAFQTVQLVRERGALQGVRANQEAPIQEAAKVRAQLDSIARRTAELATQGNPQAKTIVEELRKRGVTINPTPPAPAPQTPGR